MVKSDFPRKGHAGYSPAMTDEEQMRVSAGERLALIAASFERLLGRPFVADGAPLWSAPAAIVAHDTQDPPLFFYGNAQALSLFSMTPAQFIGLPSYKSAEPGHRQERATMFERLKASNFIDDYRGIRIASDGTRFVIQNAVVWNLIDQAGQRHGQAATFAEWKLL